MSEKKRAFFEETKMRPAHISFDWGGAIARDSASFNFIMQEIFGDSLSYSGPKSWDDFRSKVIETNKNLEIPAKLFFESAKMYPNAVGVINKYLGGLPSSTTKTSIIKVSYR